MSKEILKLKIIYAKKPITDNWKLDRIKKAGILQLKAPIETYLYPNSRSNIYLKLEDRLFFSPTLSAIHDLLPLTVRKNLIKYILEGLTVSEHSIETMKIETDDGIYQVGDFFEILGSEEMFKNIKDL